MKDILEFIRRTECCNIVVCYTGKEVWHEATGFINGKIVYNLKELNEVPNLRRVP